MIYIIDVSHFSNSSNGEAMAKMYTLVLIIIIKRDVSANTCTYGMKY